MFFIVVFYIYIYYAYIYIQIHTYIYIYVVDSPVVGDRGGFCNFLLNNL